MKNIILIILLFAGFVLNGQTIIGDKVITRTQLELAGYKVTGISNDTLMGDNSIMKLVTQYAVKNYVANYVTANSLPSQGGNSGKYLTTNGTVASWNTLPDASSTNEIQTIDTFTVASSLLRLKLSGSPVKTLAMSNFATSPAGSSMQVQYNNAGSFGALDSFTVSANPDRVGIGVPTPTARLDIQGSNTGATTYALQVRNSAGGGLFRIKNDGTGVNIGDWTTQGYSSRLNFIRPSSGTVGAYFSHGNATFDFYDGGFPFRIMTNTIASNPALTLGGTGFSGGTATTTKPTLLIEPTGTTSTGWATSGTKLGVNAESGFTGLLMDLELNGVTQFSVSNGGSLNIKGGISAPTGAITSGSDIVSGGYFGVTSKSWIRSATNGNWTLYNNATTDFGLLQFGGTTSSYPALKRSTTTLEARLADDSGFAAVQTLYDRFGSGSPESVVTAPVGAVYHRTDGGAGTSLYVKESGTGNTGWVAK